MHLNLFQSVNLFIKLMLDLVDCSKCSFTEQSDLVKCLFLPTRLDERPNFLRFLNDFIFRCFFCLCALLSKFHNFDSRIVLAR